MIVVRLEMWPKGNESKKYEIGRTYIHNTGSGSAKRGDYKVRVCRKGSYDRDSSNPTSDEGFARTGQVQDYPRLSYNVWRLIVRALLSAFPEERS